ncbi:hypothetical protein GC425_08545 [Corynebacterium sp. zg254]|uniref:Sortase n=1 Tax=Corynebacterium zhongnanshanii TaxID=2768834 RepID=A0ABQ6VG87_9CORY|nr:MULTISPECIES: hypothetical protein [Corynebacterium]KAB3519951.1 hypothetical protein F8377_08585 [Corynebacterium zhongnanshanii]MCR5914899.1 hypothetical protein [Corynebacterium sp. zg254]
MKKLLGAVGVTLLLTMTAACSDDKHDETAAEVTYDNAPDDGVYRDLKGNPVDRSNADNAGVSPAEMNQVTETGERFAIPSLKLNVKLGSVTSFNGVIEPLNYTDAFVVSDYSDGYSNPEDGSVTVVAHALDRGGYAPGNYVFNTETHKSLVEDGQIIAAGPGIFKITEQRTVKKADMPGQASIWNNQPRTLHFITCVPNSDENFVITAERV